jgi:hypothetical protein
VEKHEKTQNCTFQICRKPQSRVKPSSQDIITSVLGIKGVRLPHGAESPQIAIQLQKGITPVTNSVKKSSPNCATDQGEEEKDEDDEEEEEAPQAPRNAIARIQKMETASGIATFIAECPYSYHSDLCNQRNLCHPEINRQQGAYSGLRKGVGF